jgi:hypothetical protein
MKTCVASGAAVDAGEEMTYPCPHTHPILPKTFSLSFKTQFPNHKD